MFVAIFFGIKNWAYFFSSQNTDIAVCNLFLIVVILMVLDHAGCSKVQGLDLRHITSDIYQTLPRCSGDLSPTRGKISRNERHDR